jgi:hypothetical protein
MARGKSIKTLRFPLYHQRKRAPNRASLCEVCGKNVRTTPILIRLSAGVIGPGASGRAFFAISYLRYKRDRSDYLWQDVVVVDDAPDTQFTLGFCSISCLQRFFRQLLQRLKKAELSAKNSLEASDRRPRRKEAQRRMVQQRD